MNDIRLQKLRALMKENGIDVYYIPTADYHESEYVTDYFMLRKFMTGFTGSAGVAVVTLEDAGLWTDGRYFIQAEKQLEGSGFRLFRMRQEGVPTVNEYIADVLKEGGVIGFDARTVNTRDGETFAEIAASKGGYLKTDKDLAAGIWEDRPALQTSQAEILDEKYSGESTASKLSRIREVMKEEKADHHVITSLDDIAWILNVRGNDIPHVPVILSFLCITENDAVWFIHDNAADEKLKKQLEEAGVTVRPYEEIYSYAAEIPSGSAVLLNRLKVNYRITESFGDGVRIIDKANPSQLMKSVKNPVELENIRKAHLLDGVAVTRFMYWLKKNAGSVPMDEADASDRQEEFRREMEGFRDISFDTISGYQENAAMMHYKAVKGECAQIKAKGALLMDSGGHYDSGSTDITRTFILGPVSDEFRKHFTMVAKSNLNLASLKFLHGCNGINLDVICRAPIWKEELDYQCGTGHGVGYLLNIHEGPNSFRWQYRPGEDAPFEEGMVTTDEPGIYLEGRYGIRTENELICKKAGKNLYGQFMEFENITYVPIDLDGIDKKYLTDEDVRQLNEYHRGVYEKLSPFFEGELLEWLKEYTRAI